MEASWGSGEGSLPRGGREVEAAPPEGVPGLQVPAQEENEVRQRRQRSDEGEAGERRGGGKETDLRGDRRHHRQH